MTLKELNQAVCGLVERAVQASGLGAELVAEDLSAPIVRPSIKVELEENSDAQATQSWGEDTVPIDEGLSFTVTDGVLAASMDLTLDQLPEEPEAEPMEDLNQNLEVY